MDAGYEDVTFRVVEGKMPCAVAVIHKRAKRVSVYFFIGKRLMMLIDEIKHAKKTV